MAHALRTGPALNRLLLRTTCLQSSIVQPASSKATAKAGEKMEAYWSKNRQLNRPLSPHLSVYKLQITSGLSITNRITGAVVTGALYAAPLLYLCGSSDFAGYLSMIQSWGTLGTYLVTATKFSLAFCLSYHTCAGIRHLAWDNAMGFKLDQVYKSGYLMVAATMLMTAGLMAL